MGGFSRNRDVFHPREIVSPQAQIVTVCVTCTGRAKVALWQSTRRPGNNERWERDSGAGLDLFRSSTVLAGGERARAAATEPYAVAGQRSSRQWQPAHRLLVFRGADRPH